MGGIIALRRVPVSVCLFYVDRHLTSTPNVQECAMARLLLLAALIWSLDDFGATTQSNIHPPLVSTAAEGNIWLFSSQMPHCVNQLVPYSCLALGQ